MAEAVLEMVKRALDSEEDSPDLQQLPSDFYLTTTGFARNLKRSSGPGTSDTTIRLAQRQASILEGLVRTLVTLRTQKAGSSGSTARLLPEERYLCVPREEYASRVESFILAVASGRPSAVEYAVRMETNRKTVVRFTKPVSEVIGQDLLRYGPFKPNDLASVPSANADILVANGEAVVVHPRAFYE